MLQNISQIIKFGKGSLIFIRQFLLPVSSIIIIGCANIGPPPGGPVDKKGPEILSCQPVDGSIFVAKDAVIEFEVDEWINGDSFKDAFFISPEPDVEAKFKIGLHKLKVIYKKGFDESTTYVVTVGTDFKDLNRNSLEKSYTFAFSTGSKLDYGVVQGMIIGSASTGFITALYPLDIINAYDDSSKIDSSAKNDDDNYEKIIGPYSAKGKYMTQSGKNNRFTLPYIPPGNYRLIVFSDKDKDRIYDPGSEELGLAWEDIAVENDTSRVMIVLPVMRMSGPPEILNVDSRNNGQLNLIIDRPLEFLPKLSDIMVTDTTSGKELKVKNLFRHPIDSSMIVLETDVQDSSIYRVKVGGGIDYWGEACVDSFTFTGNATGDTLPPVIVKITAEGDSSGGVLSFLLSEDVTKAELVKGVFFSDSTFLDSTAVLKKVSPWRFTISSSSFNANDTIMFNQSFLKDFAGNTGLDSTIFLTVSPFEQLQPLKEFGSLSGELIFTDDQSIAKNGDFTIFAVSTGNDLYKQSHKGSGAFKLDSLPAGYYTLEAYLDSDNNGRFNYGLLYPFKAPERYAVSRMDTIRVRAGWESGGGIIEFK